MKLKDLRALGFDQSTRSGKYLRPVCSQCEACVINGTPCHETGCPHAVSECHGCSAVVPARVKYCEDCR